MDPRLRGDGMGGRNYLSYTPAACHAAPTLFPIVTAATRHHGKRPAARETAASVNFVNFGRQAARFSSACAASAISVAMISAAGSSLVTMPTDCPAIRLPCSTSPSITARRSAPAQ